MPVTCRLGRQIPRRFAPLPTLTATLVVVLLAACKSTPHNEPVFVVQAAYDRLNQGDVDGFMEFVSDDAVFLGAYGGVHSGSQSIREMLEYEFASGNMRVELSNLESEGNEVIYSAKVYMGEALLGEYSDGVDIVVDGKIVFDGTETWRRYYCDQDPSQTFCLEG